MSKANPDNVCADLSIDVKYDPKALGKMLKLQNDLQEFLKERRNIVVPNDMVPMSVKAKELVYFWGCATTEYFELIEALEKINDNEVGYRSGAAWREVQFEFIDIWHFLMNMFLYGGYQKERKSLADFYEEVSDLHTRRELSVMDTMGSIERLWGSLSVEVGEYINIMPFKAWKNYEPDLKVDEAIAFDKVESIISAFVHIGYVLGIDNKLFYALYVAKNKENIDRQNRAGNYNSKG